jgi:hypothetical protein
VLEKRPELCRYLSKVYLAESEVAALESCDSVVVAVPPQIQFEIVSKCLQYNNIMRYYLEKPLAVTPDDGNILINNLYLHGRDLSIGFILSTLQVFEKIDFSATQNNLNFELHWGFYAHHFSHNLDTWKRRHSDGGGVLRFYGIHLIALLVKKGYSHVEKSTLIGDDNEPYLWRANFSGNGLKRIGVSLNSKSKLNRFDLMLNNLEIFSYQTPFSSVSDDSDLDPRVSLLTKTINSNFEDQQITEQFNRNIISLWKKVEVVTEFDTYNSNEEGY